MNKLSNTELECFSLFFSLQILSFVFIGLTIAEPPVSSYLPPRVSSSYLPPSSGGSLLSGLGSGYHAVGSGYQESEGANIDPSLLNKIGQILMEEENKIASFGGGHGNKFQHYTFSIKTMTNC